MSTMHVFVDADGRLSAVIPKPVTPSDGDAGPVFAGISPAGPDDGVQGYEVEIDDELLVVRHPLDDQLERHIEGMLRRRSALTRVDYLRDRP